MLVVDDEQGGKETPSSLPLLSLSLLSLSLKSLSLLSLSLLSLVTHTAPSLLNVILT